MTGLTFSLLLYRSQYGKVVLRRAGGTSPREAEMTTTISTEHGDARILWDSTNGAENEGWFLRYSNGRQDHLDEALMSDTLADAIVEAEAFLAREGLA